MDKLKLFHAIARVAKPAYLSYTPIESLDTKFVDNGLDSLDTLLICAYYIELYGIKEDVAKTMLPTTPQEIYDFIEAHKTKEPSSLEDALEQIK
jgi:acyl carrier protein